MCDASFQTILKKYRWKMDIPGATILIRGVCYGILYKFLGRTDIDGCNNSIVPKSKNEERKVPDISRGDTMLWHQRLGHIGEKGLHSLQGKGMVEGMSNYNTDFDFYEHCLYGNNNREKFPFGATRENVILELIHSDVLVLYLFHHLEDICIMLPL